MYWVSSAWFTADYYILFNSQGTSQVVPCESQEFPSEHQDTVFQCEGRHTLLQVAQKGWGVSIFGDTNNTSGHGPA